jgi:TolB-like protein
MKAIFCVLMAGAIPLAGCTSGAPEPLAVGCTGAPISGGRAAFKTPPIEVRTYQAVDRLVASAPSLDSNTTFLIASVADLDQLTETGSLGRLISEEAATHLIQCGYRVPEVRLADTMHVREGGEFILSRDVADLRRVHNAELVVTGTYSSVGDATHVNLRFVRLADGVAVAATEFEIPRSLALPNQLFSASDP